jgi:hypothetical protein
VCSFVMVGVLGMRLCVVVYVWCSVWCWLMERLMIVSGYTGDVRIENGLLKLSCVSKHAERM